MKVMEDMLRGAVDEIREEMEEVKALILEGVGVQKQILAEVKALKEAVNRPLRIVKEEVEDE